MRSFRLIRLRTAQATSDLSRLRLAPVSSRSYGQDFGRGGRGDTGFQRKRQPFDDGGYERSRPPHESPARGGQWLEDNQNDSGSQRRRQPFDDGGRERSRPPYASRPREGRSSESGENTEQRPREHFGGERIESLPNPHGKTDFTDRFSRGKYHKVDQFHMTPMKKKYKAGSFKAAFYDDPAVTFEPPVEELAAELRRVLNPASSSHRSRRPDPYHLLEACLPLLKTKRQSNLDPHLEDISMILAEHFANTRLDSPELPATQKAVCDTLAICFIRAASQSPFRSMRASNQQGRGKADAVAENYANYLLHQTLSAKSDQARRQTMLDILEESFNQYQILGSGYRISVPVVSAWVVLRKALDITTPPKYKFIWPSSLLVLSHLNKFMASRGENADEYAESIHALYELNPLPDIPPTPEALKEKLGKLVSEGTEEDVLDLWALYRDQIHTQTPERVSNSSIFKVENRASVLAAFLYALKSPYFKSARPRALEALNNAAEDILSQLPRPLTRDVLHTLVAYRARVLGSAPDVETGSDMFALDGPKDLVEEPMTKRDTSLRNLKETWALATEPGQRDIKLYMLYMEGLGRLGDLTGLRLAWNQLAQDKDCEKLYREEEGEEGKGPFPPTRALNAMISASMLIPGDGPKTALYLFEEAAKPESAVPCNINTINVVLRHYARTNNTKAMQSLFALADDLHLKPDEVTYGTLIQGFLKAQDVEKAVSMIEAMVKSGQALNRRMCTIIVADLAKDGSATGLRNAEIVMTEMRRLNLPVETVTWTALISGYFRGAWIEDGWDAIYRMTQSGIALNRISYHILFKHAGEGILSEEVGDVILKLFRQMVREGNQPNSDTYYTALYPIVKREAWFEADQIVRIMDEQQYAPEKANLRALLKIIKFRRKLKSQRSER